MNFNPITKSSRQVLVNLYTTTSQIFSQIRLSGIEISFPEKIIILAKNDKKRSESAKNGKNRVFLFLFEIHPYFAPFSPKKILYTALVQKISF